MKGHPRKVHVSEEGLVGGDEDRVQHGPNHGGGCALLLRAEAIHLHDHNHVLNLQEEYLLGESEGAMERKDYPLLGHRSTGARRLPSPDPADPRRLSRGAHRMERRGAPCSVPPRVPNHTAGVAAAAC